MFAWPWTVLLAHCVCRCSQPTTDVDRRTPSIRQLDGSQLAHASFKSSFDVDDRVRMAHDR